MRYYVIGDDGMKYGPADLHLLQMWANEGRVRPDHMLQLETGGQPMPASTIIGLQFHQPQAPYQPSPQYSQTPYGQASPYQPTPYQAPTTPGAYNNPYSNHPSNYGGYPSYGAVELRFAWACSIISVLLLCGMPMIAGCASVAGIVLATIATRRGQRASGPVALSLVVLVLLTLELLARRMI